MRNLAIADIVTRFKGHVPLLEKDSDDASKLTLSVGQIRDLVNAVRTDAATDTQPVEPKAEDRALYAVGFDIEYPLGIRTITAFNTRRFVDHLVTRVSNPDFVPTHEEGHAMEIASELAGANQCLLDYNSNEQLERIRAKLSRATADSLDKLLASMFGMGAGPDKKH